jgi:hypothetical protein
MKRQSIAPAPMKADGIARKTSLMAQRQDRERSANSLQNFKFLGCALDGWRIASPFFWLNSAIILPHGLKSAAIIAYINNRRWLAMDKQIAIMIIFVILLPAALLLTWFVKGGGMQMMGQFN